MSNFCSIGQAQTARVPATVRNQGYPQQPDRPQTASVGYANQRRENAPGFATQEAPRFTGLAPPTGNQKQNEHARDSNRDKPRNNNRDKPPTSQGIRLTRQTVEQQDQSQRDKDVVMASPRAASRDGSQV